MESQIMKEYHIPRTMLADIIRVFLFGIEERLPRGYSFIRDPHTECLTEWKDVTSQRKTILDQLRDIGTVNLTKLADAMESVWKEPKDELSKSNDQ